MFDNIALNVAIGLVMVYLLYSLLITLLGESTAAMLGLRARILRIAIERMLNDGNYAKPVYSRWLLVRFFQWLWRGITGFYFRFTLRQHKSFYQSFAGRFYQYPSIKYLAKFEAEQKGFMGNTKPSYITPENFAKTLVNMLAAKGSGKTLEEQVGFSIRNNTLHIETQTLLQLTDMLSIAGSDLNTFRDNLMKWFNETMDRTSGWYKRKLQQVLFILGFLVALSFNIDTISISRFLLKDKDARSKMVDMALAMSKDTARYKAVMDKKADSLNRNAILDSGYHRITLDLQEANLVLGLGWQFNQLYKETSREIEDKDRKKRLGELVWQLDTIRKTAVRHKQQWTKHKTNLDAVAYKNTLVLDSLRVFRQIAAGKNADPTVTRIEKQQKLLADTIRLTAMQLRGDSMMLAKLKTASDTVQAKLLQAAGIKRLLFVDSVHVSGNETKVYGKRTYSTTEKLLYIITSPGRDPIRLLGWVLTAFALSMGAPFWFGLLNKLMTLRSVGVKPEDKTDTLTRNPSSLETTSLPGFFEQSITTDITKQANVKIGDLKRSLLAEQGVNGVGIKPLQADGKQGELVILAETQQIADFLKNKYSTAIKEALGASYGVDYKIKPPLRTQLLREGSEIRNESRELGSGTLGAFMRRKKDQHLYFISCWHVMKDNSLWTMPPAKRNIIGSDTNGPVTIGYLQEGYLSGRLDPGVDIGIARYTPGTVVPGNPAFAVKGQHREVTNYDAVINTPVRLYGKVSGMQSAKIYLDSMDITMKYPGGEERTLNDVFLLIVVTGEKSGSAPATSGDSGAMVLDENGIPLGMIVGGNDYYSFASKFTNIFSQNNAYSDYYFNV